jgi:hypothetical protein
MQDEQLFKACVRVASAILTNITAALLIEMPLMTTWYDLTYHVFFCILTTGIAIRFERALLE